MQIATVKTPTLALIVENSIMAYFDSSAPFSPFPKSPGENQKKNQW
jgi:hypothetical protein